MVLKYFLLTVSLFIFFQCRSEKGSSNNTLPHSNQLKKVEPVSKTHQSSIQKIENPTDGQLPIDLALTFVKKECNQGTPLRSAFRLTVNEYVYYLVETEGFEVKLMECKDGNVTYTKTGLLPIIEEGEAPPLSIQVIGTKQYLLLNGFSGGAGCCFSLFAFSLNPINYIGEIETFSSIAAIQDINDDSLSEIIVYDFNKFQSSPNCPLPPKVAIGIEKNKFITLAGSSFEKFYLKQSESFYDGCIKENEDNCGKDATDKISTWKKTIARSGAKEEILKASKIIDTTLCSEEKNK